MSENESTVKVMLESTGLVVIDPCRWAYSRDRYFRLDFGFEEIEEFVKSVIEFGKNSAPIVRMVKNEAEGWPPFSGYLDVVSEVYLCLVEPNILHRLVITESDLDSKQ